MSSTNIIYLLVAAAAAVLVIAYRDYRTYVSFGSHGLPANFRGWYTQLKMSRRSRKDVTAAAPYNLDEALLAAGAHASSSYLRKPLAVRDGERPTVPGFVAPQRQTTDTASEGMKKRMFAFLDDVARANGAVLQSDLSVLEGAVPALQLKAGAERPDWMKRTRGEVAHIHPPDGSTHMMLSLADSRAVIEQAWGMRHRLSGTILPWNYTLMYAPRNDAEFETWKSVVQAAVSYCCYGMAEVKSV